MPNGNGEMNRFVPLEGILLVDKPAGITSHDVVDAVRRRFRIRRVGHGGTLDPAATGLLVILVGGATRKAEFLLGADKTYRAVLRLGETTDTLDREGRLIERRPVGEISREQIQAACSRFVGEITQEIPAYSASRIGGQRSYDLARKGLPVPKRFRRVRILSLEVEGIRLPDVDLKVVCSKGTYVRALCADIGRELGCGGHLRALSRTGVGPFTIEQAVSLDGVSAERLIPLSQMPVGKKSG